MSHSHEQPFCATCDDDGIIVCPVCDDHLVDAAVCEKCFDFGEINCPDCKLPEEPDRLGERPTI